MRQMHSMSRSYTHSKCAMTSYTTRMASSLSVPENAVGNNILEAMEALRVADAVCFDVDSTVITEEGIVSLQSLSVFSDDRSLIKLTYNAHLSIGCLG